MPIIQILREHWQELEPRYRLWCGYAVILLLGLALAWSALATKVNELENKRKAREAVLKELMPLKVAYQTAKSYADQSAGRMAALRPDDTPAKIVEEIGIKGKGLKVAPAKGDERPGFVEDAAEIKIDGLTSNELLNVLYRVELGSRPLIVKKGTIRGRFDDPSKLDLTLTVALIKPAQVQAKQQ